MTTQERITQTEARFDELSKQRDEINQEMIKLQGEYRVLRELEAEETGTEVNKEATTVEAVPEGETA